MKFKPKNRDELYKIIEEIIINQTKISSKLFKKYPYGLKDIDVSLIDDMSSIFSLYYNENRDLNIKINWEDPRNDITAWDVSNVTNMYHMFYETQFNQDISSWNVSRVKNMSHMFYKTPFNQPIDSWDVGSVTTMSGMFDHSQFNQDISKWNVSSVTSMKNMFSNTPFNQPLNSWNVSNVKDIEYMFYNSLYNHPLDNWNMSNITDMEYMFAYSKFNQRINSWDVSNVTNMNNMFYNNLHFNQDISRWNVKSVINMKDMFTFSIFNQDISPWFSVLNSECNLNDFNYDSEHEKKFGTIKSYEDFLKKQLTKKFIKETLQNGSDKDKFKLLKIIKNYPSILDKDSNEKQSQRIPAAMLDIH